MSKILFRIQGIINIIAPDLKQYGSAKLILMQRLTLHLSVSGLLAGGGGGQGRGGVTADWHRGGVTGHTVAGRLDSRLIVRPTTAIQRQHYRGPKGSLQGPYVIRNKEKSRKY